MRAYTLAHTRALQFITNSSHVAESGIGKRLKKLAKCSKSWSSKAAAICGQYKCMTVSWTYIHTCIHTYIQHYILRVELLAFVMCLCSKASWLGVRAECRASFETK